jgi:DNA-binding response OmpR family regulator
MAELKLTPTERRLYEHLADGEPHHRTELMKLLNDELTTETTLFVHLYKLRLKLKTIGEDVISQIGKRRQVYVRRVKHLNSKP